jgi:uncharacterized protein
VSYEEKRQLAVRFLTVLGKPDIDVVRNVAVEDMIWTFPGSSPISGEARGLEAIVKRAKVIAANKVRVEIVHTVYGLDGVSIILHNTGKKDDRVLDEHLAAVFAFRGGKIERLDTHLSDVPNGRSILCLSRGSDPSQTLQKRRAGWCHRQAQNACLGKFDTGVSDDLDWPDNENRVHGKRYRWINERH